MNSITIDEISGRRKEREGRGEREKKRERAKKRLTEWILYSSRFEVISKLFDYWANTYLQYATPAIHTMGCAHDWYLSIVNKIVKVYKINMYICKIKR